MFVLEPTLLELEAEVVEVIYANTKLEITHYQGNDDDIVFHYACGNRLISLFIDSDSEGYVADSDDATVSEYLSKDEAVERYLHLLQDSQ